MNKNNITEFWNFIDSVKPKKSYTFKSYYASLMKSLSRKSNEELVRLQAAYDVLSNQAYTWDLWGAAYIIKGGCSDDDFIDFRTGLIFQGQSIFEKVLLNPDELSSIDTAPKFFDYEEFGNSFYEVYDERTDDEPDFESLVEKENRKIRTPSGPAGNSWRDDSELVVRFPNLANKYPKFKRIASSQKS